MEEADLQHLARQLARPDGRDGIALGEKMNEANAYLTARAIEAFAPGAGQRIAEIGPGNGALSLPVVRALGPEGRYIGLELSGGLAREARRNLSRAGGARVEVHAGDCLSAPIEPRSLDGVLAVNLLYFIDDLAALFTALATWLKPGGRAVFGLRAEKALKGMPFTRFGFHIRSTEDIAGRLRSAGFAEIQWEEFPEAPARLDGLEIPMDSLVILARVGAP